MPFHVYLEPGTSTISFSQSLASWWKDYDRVFKHKTTHLPDPETFQKLILHVPIPQVGRVHEKGEKCHCLWNSNLVKERDREIDIVFEAEQPHSSWWDFENNKSIECIRKISRGHFRHVSIIEAIMTALDFESVFGNPRIILPSFLQSDKHVVHFCKEYEKHRKERSSYFDF